MIPIHDTHTQFRVTFDPVMFRHGHHALTSEYVETFWLPVLGPSSVMLLRALGRIYEPIASITATPSTNVQLIQLGTALGIRGGVTNNSRMGRTLERLRFRGFVERTGDTSLRVAAFVPDLRPALVEHKLPAFLQAIHPSAVRQHLSCH